MTWNWNENRYGHIEVEDHLGKTRIYLQVDYDVEAFLEDVPSDDREWGAGEVPDWLIDAYLDAGY